MPFAFAAGIVGVLALARRGSRPVLVPGLVLGLPALAWIGLALAGRPSPSPGRRPAPTGGGRAPGAAGIRRPAAGPLTYTAAFIAEIVRAGLASVARGQGEAAAALGLSRVKTLRLVTIPQAMRVIVPPLTSQYLNVTKNSSLAVLIGYPDLVHVVMGTVLNQTNQAVEVVAITMAVYSA